MKLQAFDSYNQELQRQRDIDSFVKAARQRFNERNKNVDLIRFSSLFRTPVEYSTKFTLLEESN